MTQDVGTQAEHPPQHATMTEEILLSLNQIVWAIALPAYELLHISPSIESICGCSAHQLMQKPKLWLTVLHRDDRAATIRWLHSLQPAMPAEHQFRIATATGSIEWVHCRAVLVNDDLNQSQKPSVHHIRGVACIIGSSQDTTTESPEQPASTTPSSASPFSAIEDISDRKRSKDELHQAQAMLRLIIDNIPQRILWKDRDLKYLGCNLSQAKVSGLASPDDIVGKTDYDLPWTREQADYYRACDRRVMEQNQPEFAISEKQRQSDGHIRWLEANKIPLHDAQGNVIGVLGTVEDVTTRWQAEKALKQQVHREHTLNQVIQAIRDSLDVPTIFQSAKRPIAELFNAHRVCILHYLSSENIWQLTTECQEHDILSKGFNAALQTLYDQGIEHLEQGNIVVVPYEQLRDYAVGQEDSIRAEASLPHPSEATQTPEHCTFIPLLVSHDAETLFQQPAQTNLTCHYLWGCLCIMTSAPNTVLDDVEQELARVIANQLAIAIHQSELYQRIQAFNQKLERTVQQRTNELQHALVVEAMLKRIIDKVRHSLDERHILQSVVKELAETLVLDCCNTAIYDHDARLVHIQQECITINLRSIQGQIESFSDRPEIYRQLLSGIAFQYSQLLAEDFRPDYTPTILCFPIISSDQVVGDLWLYRPRYATFSKLEVNVVEQIVSQCAIAIRQARLYQAAQAQVNELERLNHMKDDFLSTVSHELRTPVANIKMAAQMLEIMIARCQEEPDEQLRTYLQILQDEAQQEMELINDLLDLQHLNAGTRPLELVNVELQEWIPHIVESFQLRAEKHQQAIAIQVDDDLPSIYSDLVSLQRIMSELLNNACKYTPPGEAISLRAWSPRPDQVAIAVSNTGVHIAPSELSRIFDKFYRIPQSDRWKHGGTGLGLALVRELTHHLSGTITVTSENNITCFTIYLPLYAQGRS